MEGDRYCSKCGRPLTEISIHTLRVEGELDHWLWQKKPFSISIHTLRVEGDCRLAQMIAALFPFLSTPSVWRVTDKIFRWAMLDQISIHTLRVEGD